MYQWIKENENNNVQKERLSTISETMYDLV